MQDESATLRTGKAMNHYFHRIAEALKDRIIWAYNRNECFKVIVVIPLMPGFEGDIADSGSAVLRAQVRLLQESVSKGKYSLLGHLEEQGIDWS